jgi:arylamine N-acetyltransferase
MVRVTSRQIFFTCVVYIEASHLVILIWNHRSHSVNLVHIAGQTYLVDVGFGGEFYTSI